MKFAHSFKIPELIDSVMLWFQEHLSTVNLTDIINILSDLQKLGYSFDHLMEIIRNFIENNTDVCLEIIKVNFEDDVKTVIDLLMYNGPLVKDCILLFNSDIRQEKDYEYLIEKLENMSLENEVILNENSEEINKIMDTVMNEVESSKILKRWIKLVRSITPSQVDNKPTSSGLSSTSSDKELIKFQSWRRFDKSQILEVKTKHGISEYHYTVICLDWVEVNKPKQEDVVEIFHSIQQEKLEYLSVLYVRYILCDILNYRDIPHIQVLPVYEHDKQWWVITKQQLLSSLNNNTAIQLSEDCDIDSCTNKQTAHTVNIRFVTKSGKVDVQILPVVNVRSDQHEHDIVDYMYWYLCEWDNDYYGNEMSSC